MAEVFEVGARSLPNAIADQLRALVVRGTLLPGEHLGQTQLAARFGKSKVPIREALKLLATEGLLRHDRNRGYFVASLSFDEAIQLYKLRRWLECELLSTAAWPSDEMLQELRRRFDRLDALEQQDERQSWLEALQALRYDIFDLSPQKLLLREALRLWTLTDRYRALLPRTYSGSPERRLVDALAARDRHALLAEYHKERDQLEALLAHAFADEAAFDTVRAEGA